MLDIPPLLQVIALEHGDGSAVYTEESASPRIGI